MIGAWLDYILFDEVTVGMVVIVVLIVCVFALAAWSRAMRKPPKGKVE